VITQHGQAATNSVEATATTGMLNPVAEIGRIVKSRGRLYTVDAMSSFGGMPMDVATIGADYLVSSANKRIQGVPGFGFVPLLAPEHRSPIITAFHSPDHPDYRFEQFYANLKHRGFVIYPGKVTAQDTFRIGTIGDVQPADIVRLVAAVAHSM
jgi:aspartate aminotransferase-like enzyme